MLRDYQIEICEKVNEAFKAHRSVMVQMPTGTGKTMVLATLVIKKLKDERIKGRSGKILIVAHRRELIEQIQNTLTKVFFFENSPVPSYPEEELHLSLLNPLPSEERT